MIDENDLAVRRGENFELAGHGYLRLVFRFRADRLPHALRSC